MKKVSLGLVMIFLMITLATKAQTIDEGKKNMYYERYGSAKNIFQSFLAKDPNNEEATYYLGQSIILNEDKTDADIAAGKSIYQTFLQNHTSSALIIVGIGHIELLEGKVKDARSHFEAAVGLSKGKSIAVLNAIGFANIDAKNGDPVYAISKLNEATQIKKFNDPEVWVNLGDAYRKIGDGGNAFTSYNNALAINSKYARASFRLGKIFLSQGRGQESIFMEHFQNALNNDPAYGPVYAELYAYYYETNINKAAEYYDKMLANIDKGKKTCYYTASIKYAQGKFQEAIDKAGECIAAEGANPYPNLFGLKAYAYNRLKDSINAILAFQEYFKRQNPDKLTSGDCIGYAKNLLKVAGNESVAELIINRAVSIDTLELDKVNDYKIMADYYASKKNFKAAADWYTKIVAQKKAPSKFDIQTAAFNYYKSGAFQTAIDMFNVSLVKFPDDKDPLVYNLIAKASWAIDSTMSKGMANAAFEKTILLGSADTIKFKPQLMNAYKYFVAYYANIKKDKTIAMAYVEKALALDPNDAEAKSYKASLSGNAPKSPAKKPK
jgi:Flp pilus assembly protein TadD